MDSPRSRTITARAQREAERLNREREGDRGAAVRRLEQMAEQTPFDKGLQWAASALRRALERERGHG